MKTITFVNIPHDQVNKKLISSIFAEDKKLTNILIKKSNLNNKQIKEALHYLIYFNWIESVEKFINKYPVFEESIDTAILYKRYEIVQLLLPKIDKETFIINERINKIVILNNITMMRILFDYMNDNQKEYALHQSCVYENLSIVKFLTEKGCVSKKGFLKAVSLKRHCVVDYLINKNDLYKKTHSRMKFFFKSGLMLLYIFYVLLIIIIGIL